MYWRFEVQYTFPSEQAVSSINFKINQPPSNGICSINPRSGTINTLFTISCSNWFDDDGIKDYSVYTRLNENELILIGSSLISNFRIYLPAGDEHGFTLDLIIRIRDALDSVREILLSNITVQSDLIHIDNLLSTRNPNTIAQIITSISKQLNTLTNEHIFNDIPAASISISSLNNDNHFSQQYSSNMNSSALNEYKKQLNSYANIRDILIPYLTNLSITNSLSIQLQSSSLAQLTQTSNQLTRTSCVSATND